MDQTTYLVHKRNLLVCKLSWGFLAVALIAGLHMGKDLAALLVHPIMFAVVLGLILTAFVAKKVFTIPVMYGYICLIYLYFFLLITGSPLLGNFLFMWLGLVFSAIYQSYIIIVLSGTFSLLISFYAFFIKHDIIFPQVPYSHFVYIILFNIFLTLILLAMTRFIRNLWLKAQKSQIQLNNILENVDIATWTYDVKTGEFELSSSLQRVTGVPTELVNQDENSWRKFTHPEDIKLIEAALHQTNKGIPATADFRIIGKDGSIRWMQSRIFPLVDKEGKITQSAGVIIDITDHKHMEEKIEHLAYHDSLTGLPNRAYLEISSHYILQEAKQTDSKVAVLFMDLNRFKSVNDSLGHQAGDKLLRMIAARLKEAVRDRDLLARVGGDEFVVVLQGSNRQEFLAIAERLVNRFNDPFSIDGQLIPIALSLGVSIYPDHGTTLDDLLNKADQAMYAAKQLGDNQIVLFGTQPSS